MPNDAEGEVEEFKKLQQILGRCTLDNSDVELFCFAATMNAQPMCWDVELMSNIVKANSQWKRFMNKNSRDVVNT